MPAIEGPSSPSWLAEHLGLTTGAMTKMLDRLQRAGYITRSADPRDRRRIIDDRDIEALPLSAHINAGPA